MRSRLAQRIHLWLERRFPEKRLFLRSDTETRFVRLTSGTQFVAVVGATTFVAWTIVATSVLLMDSVGAGNFREQAKRNQAVYEERLNALAAERDARAAEAVAAQERFSTALESISEMQSQLLASEDRRRELEKGLDVVQATLRDTMRARDTAREEVEMLTAALESGGELPGAKPPEDLTGTMSVLTAALASTATERDTALAEAREAIEAAEELELELQLTAERNDQIFRQLEEAMSVSVEPLDRMFRAAGLPTERIIEEVRRGYSGQGGPLEPITFSTRGAPPHPDSLRANEILERLDELNLYRIAAQKAPFAQPVLDVYRFTSGFGYRRDPKTGGRRMHNGVDFASRTGTPIYATADGVVTHAAWQSGYGRLVKIRHDFGIETRYAHLSRIRVNVGERVSRGDRIGDMGATGRVTGTHLHYEVHLNGRPVNPMDYIRAARDVF